MITRLVIIGAAGLALFLAGMQVGIYKQQAKDSKAVIGQQKDDAKAVMGLNEADKAAKENSDVIIRTIIRKVPDPSGCLDTPSPDAYVDGLRRIYDSR